VEDGKSELLNKIKAMRRQLATELGFIVPSIHIKDNLQLRPHEYRLALRGIETARSEVMPGYRLAMASGEVERIEGIPTKEPAFGLPAYWIRENEVEKAQAKGYMVVDPGTAIATHLAEVIKTHAWELLTRTEVQNLLNTVSKNYPKIVEELIPTQLTLGNVQRVLQNLLKERIPINDIVLILETLLDHTPGVKDPELLTEFARQALARHITKKFSAADGSIRVVALDPKFERALAQGMESGGAISPDIVTRLMSGIEKAVREDKFRGGLPVILCSATVRRFLQKITARFIPGLAILSNAEIAPSAKLYTTGVVKYED
jgi:flagellar biosynthesis protein FlhA